MTPTEKNSEPRTLTDFAYQFLLGALLGFVVSLLPLAVIRPALTTGNITAVVIIVALCGVLSALFGKRFLKPMMNFLESLPPIA
ncbi:hypothetical protein [Adonisia turfae]|uniref:Uncharacterized protein n=1 Tax=Adonisia turfae CCMR0081 TaxID=2292702 RepID=A0A6M0RP05_9CYAN|nr:hypothetical protein [Adonisia turfae]NEZ57997.1 hypothetical protein [Adonisia turfae CCMR0081]